MPTNRIYGLDMLRAYAILNVVWFHGAFLVPDAVLPVYNRLYVDGVSVFFVLSGFLIGGILIKILESAPAGFRVLRDFWRRRWLRTLPAYFVVLSLLTIIHLAMGDAPGIRILIRFYAFIQNLCTPMPGFFGESWSLSVEEWFYLITPVLIIACMTVFRSKVRAAIPIVALLIIAAVTGLRWYRFAHMDPVTTDEWDYFFRKQVVTRLDGLMFGVLGAYAAYYFNRYWLKFRIPLFMLGLLLLSDPLPFRQPGFYACVCSFAVFSLGTLSVLPLLSSIRTGKGRLYRVITFISLISYSMYLTHLSLVRELVIRQLLTEKVYPHVRWSETAIATLNYIVYWGLTIALSALLYRWVERPFMRRRGPASGDALPITPASGDAEEQLSGLP